MAGIFLAADGRDELRVRFHLGNVSAASFSAARSETSRRQGVPRARKRELHGQQESSPGVVLAVGERAAQSNPRPAGPRRQPRPSAHALAQKELRRRGCVTLPDRSSDSKYRSSPSWPEHGPPAARLCWTNTVGPTFLIRCHSW